MKLIDDVSDFGAPEFVVNGPANVEWVSRHQVRMTYYVKRNGGKVATHHTIWDIDDLGATHAIFEVILRQLRQERLMATDCVPVMVSH